MSCFSLIAGRWSKLEVHRALWIANLKICWRFCTTGGRLPSGRVAARFAACKAGG
jgi:hypothetical protein